jgi:hypothetical protein
MILDYRVRQGSRAPRPSVFDAADRRRPGEGLHLGSGPRPRRDAWRRTCSPMGLSRGDRVAILSKNCAHFFIAELAIWIGGFTTVAIFPTEGPDTIRFVLEHSEAKFLFVGKLDTWPQQAGRARSRMPRVAFPLAPPTKFETWDAVVARTQPLARPPRPRRGRPGDAHLHLRLHRPAEGRDAQLRPHHPRQRGHRARRSRHVRGPRALVPAARARLRARVHRVRLVRRRRPHLLRRGARHLRRRPQAGPADALHLGAAAVAEVPAGRLRQDAAEEARTSCSRSRSSARRSPRRS